MRGLTKTIRAFPAILACWLFLGVTGESLAQSQRYWITFRDRGGEQVLQQTRSFAHRLGITDRALWRRGKVLQQNRLLDELDLPVSNRYLQLLRAQGLRVRATSRWLNAVSVEMSPRQFQSLHTLPWVASVQPVAVFKKQRPEISPIGPPFSLQKRGGTVIPEYGTSFVQLNSINVVEV
ncbi:MAG: hypothetical protein WD182_02820, partial [Bacteroidota bacterium]